MSINIVAVKAFAKYDDNGSIDYEASQKEFLGQLQGFAAQVETDGAAIEAAAMKVFEEYPEGRVTGLQEFIVRQLNTTPANHSVMKKMVADWVRANTGETREEGKLIQTQKGRGQFGSRLWANVPVSEDTAKAEKAAAKSKG
jgi:hypothetical protein